MHPQAPAALTSVRFRRDIKYFLSALVGYLIVVVLVLVLVAQRHLEAYENARHEHWAAVADLLTMSVDAGSGNSFSTRDLTAQVSVWQGRYGLTAIVVRPQGGPPVEIGNMSPSLYIERRHTRGAELAFGFDRSDVDQARRGVYIVVAICIASVILATLLLVAYLPRIVRPIERMLESARALDPAPSDARDEAQYLIETFKTTIDRLQAQEAELKRLHDSQKSRADELERVTAALTRSLTSGFLALNREGRLVEMNAAAAEILRLPGHTGVQGRTLGDVVGDTPFAARLAEAVERRSAMLRVETVHRTADATSVIGLTAVPLRNEEDEFLGTIALFTDLTPFRRLQSQLVESQTLAGLGEITAGIAHEFRNSLSSILGYIKLARRDELPSTATTRLGAAEEEARGLTAAVEALMNFARPFRVDWQPVALGEIVEPIVDRIRAERPALAIETTGAPFALQGDPSLLVRAIENVLRNSAEAIERKGDEGRIEVAFDPDVRTLTIRDNGIGLESGEAARLFLPFQSDHPKGFGLGLALTKKIVLLHGGTIELTGATGEGATVTMHFPSQKSTD